MAKRASVQDPRKAVPAPAGYVRFLLKKFGTSERLRSALIEGTDIDEERLQRTSSEVTLFTFVTFSANLSRIVGEDWPLDAMAAWSTAMQGALEVAVRSAPSVGEGLDNIRQFGVVRAPFLRIELIRGRSTFDLVLTEGVEIEPAAWRSLSIAVVVGLTGMLVSLVEERRAEIVVQFPWRIPSYAERLRTSLPTQVSFGGRLLAISVPRDLCGNVPPSVDHALHSSAVAELEAALVRISNGNDVRLRLQQTIARHRRGRLSEAEAADMLGMSRRTLVRRLSESGTSFRSMLDADLKTRAREMLDEQKLTRTEMAERLGFDDPTSFSRACRRWFS